MSRIARTALTIAVIAACVAPAAAQINPLYDGLWINELFFDPPGDEISRVWDPNTGSYTDFGREYVELRGTPGMSLDGHYLVLTENENSTDPGNYAGTIDGVFDLSGMTIGTNGYAVLLMRNFERGLDHIAPGTAIYQNTGGVGFGVSLLSTIGWTDQRNRGTTENGAFSALLVEDHGGDGYTYPWVGHNLDYPSPDAVISPQYPTNWTFGDSIGQMAPGEADGYTYAAVTFSDEAMDPNRITPGGVNVHTALEPEFMFRVGTSTGVNPEDWFMANLTENNDQKEGNPYPGATSWRVEDYPEYGYIVSGPHDPDNYHLGELVRGQIHTDPSDPLQTGERNWAPEGTAVQNTLGRPNFPIPDGDLNQDGVVGQDDLDIVLAGWGQTNPSLLGYWLFGDPSGDGSVGQDDLDQVLANWGRSAGGWVFTQTDLVWQNFPGYFSPATAAATAPDFDGFDLTSVDTSALADSPWAQAVPEPASMSLLMLGALSMLRRRKK